MIGHPSEQQLLAFQDHRLGDRRRRKLAGHLSGCQRCRNLMQSHRSVRGVFALEAPFAPDGVLQRVLASRASGVAVVLPVAEPDARRHGGDPLRLLAIAAGMLITVIAAVQVVPVTALKEAWGDWSGMIADWKPLGEGGVLDIDYPAAPIAKAARPVPSRIRPYSATYLVPQRDGPPSRIYVVVKQVGPEWQVTEHYGGTSRVTARFDTAAFGLLGWTYVRGFGRNDYTRIHRLQRRGSAFLYEHIWTGDPPPSYLSSQPPEQVTGEFEGFVDGPTTVGTADLWVLLSAMPFKLGWAGSVREVWYMSPPSSRYGGRPTTYLVTGSETVITPIGSFEAWAVEILVPPGTRYRRTHWFRKSDGLMLKVMEGRRGDIETQYEIESVTYH